MKLTIEQHPAKDYVRDERVNRVMSQARVDKLRANLNTDGIGVFVTSKRKNGEMVLLDGAHRSTALVEEGLEDFKVNSIVYHDLSLAEEAKLFLIYNDRLAVDILQRFRLQVQAKDSESIVIDDAIRKIGFTPEGGKENSVTCIGSLQALYRGGTSTGRETHRETLEQTLRIIKEAWGTEKSLSKESVKGIGGLLLTHEDLDMEHLIDALRALPLGPTAIRTKTTYHVREGGKSARIGAELAVAECYNRGLAAAKKIKP